ncbi:hypothetical protein NYO98_09950 [Nocardioides sp. STR2]|uniref:Oligosaccharide repeat unit polymerase n=1 Tax=Nocardioides pini TaxID=2975053 RepID=A0ABT4CF71_9ACTN|nr:hypothetical protein [Nocardioides pini]MCY4726599.1 hypothetical protein [Nocardioides pini]
MERQHGLVSLSVLVNLAATSILVATAETTLITGIVWSISALVSISYRLGLKNLHDPSVMVFWLGVLPSALGLSSIPFSSYQPHHLATSLMWLSLGTYVAIIGVVDRPVGAIQLPTRAERARLGWMGLVASAATLGAAAVFFSQRGVTLLMFNAEQARVDASSGAGPLLAIVHIGASLAVGAVVLSGVGQSRAARNVKLVLVALCLVAVALTASRGALLKALLVGVGAALATRSWKSPLSRLVTVAAAAVLSAWLLGELRYAGGDTSFASLAVQRLAADPYSAGIVFDARSDPRVSGLHLFGTAFSTYLPGSQPLIGDILKSNANLSFAGGAIAVPLAAEGFLFLGVPGVVIFSGAAALVPVIIKKRIAPTVSGTLVGTVFGTTWAGVFGAGIATTVATYGVPAVVLGLAFYWTGLLLPITSEPKTRTQIQRSATTKD